MTTAATLRHFTHRDTLTKSIGSWAAWSTKGVTLRAQTLCGPGSARLDGDVWVVCLKGALAPIATCSNATVARNLLRSSEILDLVIAARANAPG